MTKDEFEGLIDRYLTGEATSAEEKVVDDFFKTQEKKKTLQHYKLSEQMWSSIQAEITNEKISSVRHFQSEEVSKPSSLRAILFPVSIAASLIIGAFFIYKTGLINDSPSSEVVTAYSARGQKSLITLTDGSKIYLNSGSSISYPKTFSSDKREIALTGEAFFEVAPDESKPFIVRTRNVVTQVLGTSFNISAFTTSDISITVAEGKVKVSAEVQLAKGSTESKEVVLLPNQQATYQDDGQALKTEKVDVNRFIAWKNNNLYFESTPLQDAARQLERWYGVTIEFENEKVKNCLINGQFKDMALTNVLESIQYMYGQVKFRFIGDNKVLLYGEGCK